jgi:hypothetical protein
LAGASFQQQVADPKHMRTFISLSVLGAMTLFGAPVSEGGKVEPVVVVMGAVNRPSSLPVEGRLGLLQAIEGAKGFTRYADQKSVKVLAGGVKENATIYDMGKIRDGNTNEPDLRAGDVVLVPETK